MPKRSPYTDPWEPEATGPKPGTRWCWQCESCGYTVPACRVNPKGGAPSLKKCGVCDGQGWLEDGDDA